MRFRTEIEPLDGCRQIDHTGGIVMLGSCFTDEIGNMLRNGLFDVSVNPFGALFNPCSIAQTIDDALDDSEFTPSDLFILDQRHCTFRCHSRLALPDKEATLRLLNATNRSVAQSLSTAGTLIVTFGSAIAFRHIESGKIVANCHKQPSSLFTREEIPISSITDRWSRLIDRIHSLNPCIQVIMTVSPVRHIGYGAVADRRSKSRLAVACDELYRSCKNVTYFPSYEIMVDDLRDYRFYASDMVHPSETAVSYIYDLFSRSFMTDATRSLAERCMKVTRRLNHRNPTDDFVKATEAAARMLDSEAGFTDGRLYKRFKRLQQCQ